jgi:lysophospholipase L1-like esterase
MKTRWRMIFVAMAVAGAASVMPLMALDIPGVPTPTIPSAPAAPSIPSVPSVPSGPSDLPTLPSLPPTGDSHALPPTDQPHPRTNAKTGKPDGGWMKRHDSLVALAKKGGIDLYFEGDSITDFWTAPTRKGNGKAIWDKEFAAWNPGNFGISADRTEHVLWRLDNGELDGVTPKAMVLMIGTNNSSDYTGEQIAAGVTAIVNKFREKEPQAKILLLAIFPRGNVPKDNPPDKKRAANDAANAILAKLDDGQNIKFLDIASKFPDPTTPEFKTIFPDLLHPNPQGYQIWADAIKPTLTEWLGAPAATAPAETK